MKSLCISDLSHGPISIELQQQPIHTSQFATTLNGIGTRMGTWCCTGIATLHGRSKPWHHSHGTHRCFSREDTINTLPSLVICSNSHFFEESALPRDYNFIIRIHIQIYIYLFIFICVLYRLRFFQRFYFNVQIYVDS